MDDIFFKLLATTAALFSGLFAWLVFRQYWARRKAYQLVWGLAFSMFFLASLAMAIAALFGWSPFVIKVFYLFGAGLVVGYLALGTLYLLVPGFWARAGLVSLLVLSAAIVLLITPASVDLQAIPQEGWQALERPLILRLLIGIGTNGLGSLILIGGAVYSALALIREGRGRNRLIGNVLIASGAFAIAFGNTLSGLFRIGGDPALALSLTVGIILMFVGFLYASRPDSSD